MLTSFTRIRQFSQFLAIRFRSTSAEGSLALANALPRKETLSDGTKQSAEPQDRKALEWAGLVLLAALFTLFLRPLFHAPGVRAGTALRMDTLELVEGAALVLEGRVISAEAVETQSGLIETVYQLGVDRTFLGEDRFNRSIRIPGGVLENGQGMLLAGMPRLAVGEDVLLFLSAEGDRSVRIPIGLSQGRYRIETRLNGAKFAVREQAGLGLVDPSTGRLAGANSRFIRDYGDLVAEIEAAVGAKLAGTGK